MVTSLKGCDGAQGSLLASPDLGYELQAENVNGRSVISPGSFEADAVRLVLFLLYCVVFFFCSVGALETLL